MEDTEERSKKEIPRPVRVSTMAERVGGTYETVETPTLNATNLSIEEEKAISQFQYEVPKKKNYKAFD